MKHTFGKSNVFWGVALILTALLIILDAVGQNFGFIGLPVVKIIICVLIAAWGVSELVKGRFSHIFLPLGFIFAILQTNIYQWTHAGDPGLEALVESGKAYFVRTWIVIVVALLLQIGFSVLIPKRKVTVDANGTRHATVDANGTRHATVERGDGYYENDLGQSTCYVDASKLGFYKVENDLGKLEVFIENVEMYTGNGTLEVDNNLGQTVVHIPEGWAVDNRVTASLGSVTCSVPTTGSPMLTITGSCDLGNVSIQ